MRSGSHRRASARDQARVPIGRLLDFAALLLVFSSIGWLLLTAEANRGNAGPYIAVLAATAASYAVASVTSRYHPWLVPCILVVAAIAFAASRFDTLLDRPHSGPLGYSNAYASLCMSTSAAAILLWSRTRDETLRAAALIAAIAFAAIPWLNSTTTAALLVLAIPLGAFCRDSRRVELAIIGSAAAVGAVFVAVVASVGFRRLGVSQPFAVVGDRRIELWSDALSLLAENPVTGVGPGRFPSVSPTALMNTDTAWPHGEILHWGAEAGLPGALFITAMFAWAFARLWWSGRDAGTAVAALAIGATGIHANIDYVLHYPAVPMAAAAILAAGARGYTPRKPSRHSSTHSGRRGTRHRQSVPDGWS